MDDGRARCYIQGTLGTGIAYSNAVGGGTPSLGSWHTITCTFTSNAVSIKVDAGNKKTTTTT